MIKERYKVSFNMDEASPDNATKCQGCAFNVNKGDEVIVCVARNCDISAHVEKSALDRASKEASEQAGFNTLPKIHEIMRKKTADLTDEEWKLVFGYAKH